MVCKEKKQESNQTKQKRKSIKTTPYIQVSETYLKKNTSLGAGYSFGKPQKGPPMFENGQYHGQDFL